ncbi:hypothetical protein BGZ65_002137 [Modicella reniformis]|uniref:NAD(P)-binding protein n=1 Tax=Modicella reniformis TaxID=1440133 RepID=A0A9P6M9R8_9FUNG|nr:hypothetical protein BGZ65_002137 [Modicella reniformis]
MPLQNLFRKPKFWRTFLDGSHYSYDDVPDLTGQVAIVTGATGSVGYATVVALAAHGAHIFLACRNRIKAEEAIERAHADILKPHAGLKFRDLELTEAGYENHFGINHLGYFVFTAALLERIRESVPAGIVIFSFMAHELTRRSISRTCCDDKIRQSAMMRYGQSKLANILFAKVLARRLRNYRVWVILHTRGWIESHVRQAMLESDSQPFRAFCRVWLFIAYKARDDALTPLYLVSSPNVLEKDIRVMYFIPIANELEPNPISEKHQSSGGAVGLLREGSSRRQQGIGEFHLHPVDIIGEVATSGRKEWSQ